MEMKMWDSEKGFYSLESLFELLERENSNLSTTRSSSIVPIFGAEAIYPKLKIDSRQAVEIQFPRNDVRHWFKHNKNYLKTSNYTILREDAALSNILDPNYQAFSNLDLDKAAAKIAKTTGYLKDLEIYNQLNLYPNKQRYVKFTFTFYKGRLTCTLRDISLLLFRSCPLNALGFTTGTDIHLFKQSIDQKVYYVDELFGAEFNFKNWATVDVTLYLEF